MLDALLEAQLSEAQTMSMSNFEVENRVGGCAGLENDADQIYRSSE